MKRFWRRTAVVVGLAVGGGDAARANTQQMEEALGGLLADLETVIGRSAEGEKWWGRLAVQLSTLPPAAVKAAKAVGRKREAPFRIAERLFQRATTANIEYLESVVTALESYEAFDLASVGRLMVLARVAGIFQSLESMEDDARCKAARAALLALLSEGERPVSAGESCERAKARLMGVLVGPSAANETSEQIAALVGQSVEARIFRELGRIPRRYPKAWVKAWVKKFAGAMKRQAEVDQEIEKGAFKTYPTIAATRADGYTGLVIGRVWNYRVTDTQTTEDQEVEVASRTGETIYLKAKRGTGTERLTAVKSVEWIQDPVRVGTRWVAADADVEISRVGIETATDVGIFKGCIETRTKRGTDEERIVYAPGLGKVLREKFSALAVGGGTPRLMLVEREEISAFKKVEKKDEPEKKEEPEIKAE